VSVDMLYKSRPDYMPWLFDNRDAWEKAIADPRYRYDLTIDQFMAIYNEYRSGSKSISTEQAEAIAAAAFSTVPSSSTSGHHAHTAPAASESASTTESILSQDEIDNLLKGLN
jgi:hypothetical protein